MTVSEAARRRMLKGENRRLPILLKTAIPEKYDQRRSPDFLPEALTRGWLSRLVLPQTLRAFVATKGRGLAFRSLEERLDTASAAGELVFHLFGAIAHFERCLIVERTRDGLAAARARGKVFGRPPLDQEMLASALKLIEAGVRPAQAAKQLGLGRSTLYRELAALRRLVPRTPTLDDPERAA